MAATWAALRRRILTPNPAQTQLDKRGFHEKNPQARERLETVGAMFLRGYAFAAEARTADDATHRLETDVPTDYRGFAYEGAGMGFAIRDTLRPARSALLPSFLEGGGRPHKYMIYVGVGWAMARLPRPLWRKATASTSDPLLRWLVLDGYGFHQAYFHTRKYVDEHYQNPNFPWPTDGPSAYANRVIDQGIGRAMWFVCGTDPYLLAERIATFPEERRADLFSGSGLAATYAGSVDRDELLAYRELAGDYLPQVGQASAFAAAARVQTGLVSAHTELATELLCGATPEQAERVCMGSMPAAGTTDSEPLYEVWRRNISAGLAALSQTNS
ncbi:protein of unknown function DUF1702 [Catenulispora acidiphila DSM 44928]|uniref:Enediyne biosynthesis protein n=1 Tax=Catenulispora acidiphila (strain DSM 44928 / JCM 14897 / NBRC 102108 / NRRL B-24433 / ID139908) TaxID=479433 RepID=C7PWE6_CATAD|nr:DUF1702 family protein [Catenulispora acidiphila]ACU75226.1 protein of unknown function DUF1702 [Catenulispora acidiphila DSM 44928]